MNGNGGLQREYPRKGREVIGAGNAAEEVGSIDERPRCRYCGRLFSSVQHLRQHVEFTHEKWRQGPHAEEGSTATPRNPASASYGVQSPAARWDEEFLTSLSEMRMVHHVPRDAVTTIKEQVQRQVATIREQVLSRVSPHMGPGTDPESLLGDIFTLCRDFTQRDSELDRLRQSPAYVQPKRRWLGTHAESGEVFYAYDNPLDQALSAMWKTQPHTFQDVENFSERVRNGEFRTDGSYDPGLVIGDTLDGSGMGSFMKKFRLVNVGGLIVVFIFYYDGLEVVNGLGQARLTHELGCFYFAQVPLNQIYRLNSVHLRLATVCLKRAITAVGMHTVIHGLPEQQDDPGCHAWGLWMKRLKRGHSLDTPVGQRIVRGGTALLAADTPAAAECQGYKKSVGHSTKSICRSCHCEQCQGMDDSPHRSPNSFLAGLPGWKDHCKGRKQKFTLRSDKDLLEFLKKGREVMDGKMTWQAFQDWLQSMGVNDFAGALAGVDCPMDIMHIVFEGIARMQLGALAYAGINKWGWKPNDVPRRLAEFARESGCGRHELPYINTSRVLHLGQGQEGGVPSSDCSFPGTAMQVAKVILSVDAIFGPLCTEHKRDPVWQVP
jgi:hypothetical protein